MLKTYLELCYISKMKRFAKIVNSFIFTKYSILDVWQVLNTTLCLSNHIQGLLKETPNVLNVAVSRKQPLGFFLEKKKQILLQTLHKKWSYHQWFLQSMWPNPQFPAIRSHLLKKSLMENFIFYIVKNLRNYQIYKTIRSTFSLFDLFFGQNSACLKTIISFHDRPNRLICVQSEQ